MCASRPYGTCDGVCATKSDHYVSHVDHACHFCSLPIRRRLRGGPAIDLSLRGGPATEQADKSSWTLDATRCFRDSTEQLEEHVQDTHECRRTFLFAPYALVRSNSMWKQRGWRQPQHSSPNVWCRLHCETATEHPPNGGAEHGVLCDKALHTDMAHAIRASSLRPCGQCRHALGPLHMFSRIDPLPD